MYKKDLTLDPRLISQQCLSSAPNCIKTPVTPSVYAILHHTGVCKWDVASNPTDWTNAWRICFHSNFSPYDLSVTASPSCLPEIQVMRPTVNWMQELLKQLDRCSTSKLTCLTSDTELCNDKRPPNTIHDSEFKIHARKRERHFHSTASHM